MKAQTLFSFQTGLTRLGLIFAFLLGLFSFLSQTNPARAQVLPSTPDPTPPAATVKLIFIHHSTGENWLRDDYGGLGLALSQNNYFVSDTNYGWGPNVIGDRTDIPNWTEWFTSADTPTYMSALYTEYSQHSSYTRTLADPGGENEIILFKSCFPNSALAGNPTDPPSADGWLTVGHAKWVYNQILPYFGAHPEILFIVITAPPLRSGTYAANARAFNQWLYYDWLAENNYTQTNVAVFDFYNVLTGPNNHHRFNNGAEEHIFMPGTNTLYYPSGDDHPSVAGSVKATDEFIELLNVFHHRWTPSAPTCQSLTLTSSPASGGTLEADAAPNCGSSYYTNGTVVNLTPNANFGYTFSNWSGDATGSDNPLTVTMDGNRTVTANFSPAPVLPPDGAILYNNRPTFDWPDVPSAIGYQVQVSKNTAFIPLVVNSSPRGATNSTYTPASNLPANFTLYWRYRAKLSIFSYSPWSHVYMLETANPPSIPTLSAPFNNALIATTTPLLNWNNSTLPAETTFDKYEVEISSNNTFTAIVTTANVFGITNSEVMSPALLNGATYYWRVRSLNTNGDFSGWSLVRSVRVAFAGPTLVAPNGPILTLKPTFTWDAILGATSYNLQVSKVGTFAPLVINRTVATPTYTHPLNLTAGTVYYWRVRANGPYGPGTWSVTFSFTTP
jgi:uncharacterized repeat protein (TIGR02543 family)